MATYIYDNLTEEPNADYLNDLILGDSTITSNLIGIDIEGVDNTYTLTVEFETDLTTDEKTELDNLVQQCLGFEPPVKEAEMILKDIYENVSSQEQSMRFLATFNKYPVINEFLSQYNYDMAWYYLNQAKNDGILTNDDIAYLQQYIPTGDW